MILDPNTNVLANYTILKLGNGFKLVYTTESNSLPLVRFKLTESEVCATPNEYATSTGRNLYKLLNTNNYGSCTSKIGGVYHDLRYSKIGEILEKTLFDDNGVTFVLQRLPEYPIYDSYYYSWNLYGSHYIPWDLE